MSTGAMLPGFANPVLQSQASFRKIASALATPGRIVALPGELAVPAPLNAATVAAMLTLADFETSIWLSPSILRELAAVDHVRFQTSATIAADPGAASFAIVNLSQDELSLATFAQGTAGYPDRSTTVIVMVSDVNTGPVRRFIGPGIRHEVDMRITGLPADFDDQWRANRARFPLGVDILFTAGTELVGLPRSSRLLGEAV